MAEAGAAGLQEEQDEADFTEDAHAKASDSDSSDDGPPLDAYWASMLNVSKIAEPLPPPKMLSKEELEQRKNRSKGRGKGGKGKDKNAPFGQMYNAFGGKGWKGKGGGKPPRPDDINDFVEWARDPDAADGSRQRPRSRSPRRQGRAEGLDDFMSWARDDQGVKEEQPAQGQSDGLDNFLAWAAEPVKPSVDRGEDRSKIRRVAPPLQIGSVIAEAKTKKEEDDDDDDDDEDEDGGLLPPFPPPPPPPSLPVPEPEEEQKLIVPKELEEELRAAEGAPESKRERDSDDESGGGD